ncbi:MAG: alpha/beta fold hydrolase [Bdellovibrionia bacterium]
MKTAVERLQKISTDVLFSGAALEARAAVLSTVGFVAPEATLSWLLSKFATPSKHPTPPVEAEALKDAHSFKIPFGKWNLQAWSWGDGPTVVLAHGWAGRASQYFRFVPKFLKAGHSVVIFDGPGHGQTGSGETNYPEYARAIRTVIDRVDAVGLVAHSFGSMSSAFAHSQGMRPIPTVFLSAPADPRYYFDAFCARVGVRGQLKESFSQLIPRRVGASWKDLRVSAYAAAQSAPLLILQDPADTAVPWDHPTSIQAAWPGARLKATPGVGHYRILRSESVIDDVISFIEAERKRGEREHETSKSKNA